MRRREPAWGRRWARAPVGSLAVWLLLPVVAGCNVERYNFLADATADQDDDEAIREAADVPVETDDGVTEADRVEDEDATGGEDADASLACTADDDAGDAADGCPAGLACCVEESAGRCVDLLSDPLHCGDCGQDCDSDEQCVDGACRCLAGLVYCDGECFSLADDPEHCGACDIRCDSGEDCVSGHCGS